MVRPEQDSSVQMVAMVNRVLTERAVVVLVRLRMVNGKLIMVSMVKQGNTVVAVAVVEVVVVAVVMAMAVVVAVAVAVAVVVGVLAAAAVPHLPSAAELVSGVGTLRVVPAP